MSKMRRTVFGLLAIGPILGFTATAGGHPAHNRQTRPAAAPIPATKTTGVPVSATALATPKQILFYGPTAGGLADSTPNTVVTVWSEATWRTKTTADFRSFDAIVFGDQPVCFSNTEPWATAIATRQLWGPAVTGNIIVNGTDPDFHGKDLLVHQSVAFAADDPEAGPGVYASLSCAYHYDGVRSAPGGDRVELLSYFGDFRVIGLDEDSCPNAARKVVDHPALVGITDAYLSDWGCSTHEVFSSYPAGFTALATINDAQLESETAPTTNPHPYIVAAGALGRCGGPGIVDTDGDCISDVDETNVLRTNPNNRDTDGDGLSDGWEAPSSVRGSGVLLPDGRLVERDAVFGNGALFPYGPFAALADTVPTCFSSGVDENLRIQGRASCGMRAPDPLHKDVYLELDWQDCEKGDCPEVVSEKDDPLHHAPSLNGLADVVTMFKAAPVTNPDGKPGVRLHIVVDENVPHSPNCDIDTSAKRPKFFGSPFHRRRPDVLQARALVYRYVIRATRLREKATAQIRAA